MRASRSARVLPLMPRCPLTQDIEASRNSSWRAFREDLMLRDWGGRPWLRAITVEMAGMESESTARVAVVSDSISSYPMRSPYDPLQTKLIKFKRALELCLPVLRRIPLPMVLGSLRIP